MKSKLFFILMLVITALLFLLRLTGMTAHIILSVVGILALVAAAVLSRKEWKKPVWEILLRVLFALAVISGILIMNVSGVPALSIIHKASAALFALLLLVLYVPKLFKKA
ncbi:MAG: hypothetical protein Q4B50_08550 [Bacillota bacterium]|nr:hypothetical protein [Bacillota bacterium]